jgi:hypothetical protein
MQLGKLLVFSETSPALRLLRSINLPFVIDFLDRQFKQAARIAIPHSELLAALIGYQDDLAESHPGKFAAKADARATPNVSASPSSCAILRASPALYLLAVLTIMEERNSNCVPRRRSCDSLVSIED